jgi:hypothetical protein
MGLRSTIGAFLALVAVADVHSIAAAAGVDAAAAPTARAET